MPRLPAPSANRAADPPPGTPAVARPAQRLAGLGRAFARWRIDATVEQLALAASLYWLLAGNRVFFARALDGGNDLGTWLFGAALAVIVLALHFGLLLLVLNRWTARPLLALLITVSAFASFYIEHYGVYIDAAMIRNVLHTHPGEARELFTWALAGHLALYAGLPLLLLSRVRLRRRPLLVAGAWRSASLAGAVAVFVGAVLLAFQPFSSLMRNHRELRYTVTPVNWVWSLSSVLLRQQRAAAAARTPVGTDAAPGPSWAGRTRPRLLVLVVGETARAANWGLNGYPRATTPELAQLPVINFPDVSACGTSTEVSLPCMFSLQGRLDYDEERIRGSESVLHVLAHAGVDVHWIDNQSGCKGVCDGLPAESAADSMPDRCAGGDCLDDALVAALDRRLAATDGGTALVVLHMIGNHGPAYFRRYPAAFERFGPACNDDDLRRCPPEAVVNAYDNALAYTDHVLATAIGRLAQRSDRLDAALLYVSDHGESLGEKRLFLHGVPYRIAPDEQLKVPMVLWLSPGFAQASGVDLGCLAARAAQPASHDHLAHTALGLLDVHTRAYVGALDLTAGCRGGGQPIAAPAASPPAGTGSVAALATASGR